MHSSSVGEALHTLSNKKGIIANGSPTPKVKNEKRPWILRAREASVHVDSKTNWEKSQIWPLLSIQAVDGKALRRIARIWCLLRVGIWKRLMLSISSLALRDPSPILWSSTVTATT